MSFKQGIAAAANVTCQCVILEANVVIISVVPYTAQAARRLLQASIQIVYNVKVPTLDDGKELMNALSTQNVNSALQTQGVNGSSQNITKVLVTEDIVCATQCSQNTYKEQLGNTCCIPCPSQSTAPPASGNKEACQCLSNLKETSTAPATGSA